MRQYEAKGLIRMLIETRAVPPFMKNGYVLASETTREGVVIDPGDEVELLLDVVSREHLSIRYILLTHAHLDHVTGVRRAKEALGAPVGLHKDDEFLYSRVVEQGRAFGFPAEAQPPVDFFYDTEGPWRFGEYGVWVRHTPGHSPGGVCLEVGKEGDPKRVLIVGDTLFAASIGRTDLPGGNLETLLHSIRNVLFGFPDDTVVYSGHGEPTTIGRERRTNPFLV
jgi:hydroxyacylglutathione hydrolase